MCELFKRNCFSTSCFVSVLQNSDKKVWTGGQVMKIQKKIVSASCIFLFESVDMWTKGAFLFHVFFLLCSLHNVDTKSVDRWTSNENSFNFIISFYLIPFKILTKTCGQVDKQWKILKKIQPYMFYCLNVWTRMCLSISCFLSVMCPSQCWQKVWTGGQVMKILKKRSNMFYFYFLKVWQYTGSSHNAIFGTGEKVALTEFSLSAN
jgi:hypothetical protein